MPDAVVVVLADEPLELDDSPSVVDAEPDDVLPVDAAGSVTATAGTASSDVR
jgi:hypothetical protein